MGVVCDGFVYCFGISFGDIIMYMNGNLISDLKFVMDMIIDMLLGVKVIICVIRKN